MSSMTQENERHVMARSLHNIKTNSLTFKIPHPSNQFTSILKALDYIILEIWISKKDLEDFCYDPSTLQPRPLIKTTKTYILMCCE